jgi:glyoxylase-like metal-dependent hydrolase (beta-lactamase superfamily II)
MMAFYRRHGLSPQEIAPLEPLFRDIAAYATPLEADDCLDLSPRETVDGRTIEVIPTPGHTAGHVCFFFRAEGILLAGDHVLPEITPNLSPDFFIPDFRPVTSFLHSLARVGALPVTRIYPAHGAPFADLGGRIEEIIQHHRERKDRILAAVQSGRETAALIARSVFGGNLREFDRFLAVNETYVHLQELEQSGRIKSGERNGLLCYQAV